MRTVLALLLLAGTAEAGLYNLHDPVPPPPGLDGLPNYIKEVRAAAQEPKEGVKLDEASPRRLYQKQAAALERGLEDGTISTLERVDLSACYIRLGRHEEAIAVLKAANQNHFLVQANLAIAYLQSNNLEQASNSQAAMLALWPQTTVFWSDAENRFFRQCEQSLKRLIISRLKESKKKVTGPLPLDSIFDGFRIEDQKGAYFVPGGLPDSVRDKLPINAGTVLARLLYWLPGDARLYWQYGELLAMLGALEEGAKVLRDVAEQGANFQDVVAHRDVLIKQAEAIGKLNKPAGRCALGSVGLMLMLPYQPGGPGAARLVGALAAAAWGPHVKEQVAQNPPEQDNPTPGPDYPFNVQHVVVSFLFGVIVAILLALQWQEWRRKPQPAAPAEEPADPPRGTDGIKSN